ncbi:MULTISPECIES: GNAT family N-acetyltransferase [Polymorphospora]|uniref:GNAT family N-acetyltransferase n=1 Tax=Polymorphospora lycopeni TaxID=3140240 RepID=A0ABV5CUQ7_9ACTN
MSPVVVRPAEPAEFDTVARLTLAAYEADGQLKEDRGYAPTLADVAGRAATGELLVAVDEVTGRLLGSVTFVLPGSRYAELAGTGEAEFRMLSVDPAAQGRGVGEALTRACLARAAELGCHAVVISTRTFTEPAHRLYHRVGFVRTPGADWSPVPGVDLIAWRYDLTTAGP